MKSSLAGVTCKHRHSLYRDARDCGYKRERKECVYGSFVVDATGATVNPEAGAALDEATEDVARDARQSARAAECRKLRDEMRDADRRARPWLY